MILPAYSGGELRILSLMRRLRPEYRLSLLIPVPGGIGPAQRAMAAELEKDAADQVHLLALPASFKPATRSQEIIECLQQLLRRDCADIVQLEFSEMGQYAKYTRPVRTLITEHDAGILTLAKTYLRPTTPTGTVASLFGWIKRLAFEWSTARCCDRVIAVSGTDAGFLGAVTDRRKVRVVPTGVDLKHFAFQGLSRRKPHQVIFIGHYPHYPNEEAAVYLCKEIWPRVRLRLPEANLSLVGSGGGIRVRSLEARSIRFIGTVPDVRPHLAEARLFAAPIRLGCGIKGKLLEAMAAGVPIVALRETCESMSGLTDGEHLLIARDAEDFAEKAVRLLQDDALSARLASRARAYVEEYFDYDRQARLLDEVYREVLGSPIRRSCASKKQ